jgi:PAS domain-containing protein
MAIARHFVRARNNLWIVWPTDYDSCPDWQSALHGGRWKTVVDRKRIAQRLAQLAAIVQSSQDAIIGTAANRTITVWNSGAERLYGYSAAEALGQPISITVPDDCRD